VPMMIVRLTLGMSEAAPTPCAVSRCFTWSTMGPSWMPSPLCGSPFRATRESYAAN
jgi:hypothetical protein